MNYEKERIKKFILQQINKYQLDLSSFTVFTEAASSYYMFTPIIASLAGAKKVYAIACDSQYGSKETIKTNLLLHATSWGINTIEIIFSKDKNVISQSDIITNTGFVRPIDKHMIQLMKKTAVIPLMWETWEFRNEDLDLKACMEKDIAVLGTNEHHPSLNLFRTIGFKVCKLLFNNGFSVYCDNYLLISSGSYGDSIQDFFIKNGISHTRIAPSLEINTSDIQKSIGPLENYDAIIVAELVHNISIIDKEGLLKPEIIAKENNAIKILYICGNINSSSINKHKIDMFPAKGLAFRHIAITADYLGWKPILELNTAGLKVGEAMARARKKGLSGRDLVQYALSNSPADAFKDK